MGNIGRKAKNDVINSTLTRTIFMAQTVAWTPNYQTVLLRSPKSPHRSEFAHENKQIFAVNKCKIDKKTKSNERREGKPIGKMAARYFYTNEKSKNILIEKKKQEKSIAKVFRRIYRTE